jgi:membrane protease YdiL (CAAX protease family)
MHYVVSGLAGVALVCYVIREVVRMHRNYPQLKQAAAQGDLEARMRFYARALRVEWVSALLALAALGFDKTKLMATALQMGDTAFGHWISSQRITAKPALAGLATGLIIGLVGLSIARLRARSRAPAVAASEVKPWFRKLVPDFAALIPVTARERLFFAAVAVSAGICEEVVFRGWLLYVLHRLDGLNGTALILLAAALFGLCHTYQGVTGVVGTTMAGVLLAALYVATGTLLVPIVLHCLIDLRMAILPTNRPQDQVRQET